MGNDDRERDTPVTGRDIPRPRPKLEAVSDEAAASAENEPQPVNPSIADVYALIDKRLSPLIVQRISSAPPPASTTPRESLPVRAAKKTPKWLAYLLAALSVIGQIIALASQEEYRGPIVQGFKLIAFAVSEIFSEDPTAPPELAPEPISPMLPPAGE